MLDAIYLSPDRCNEREQIIFNRDYDSENYKYGGAASFEHIDVATAKSLIKLGYVDPDDSQNGSPTAQEFVDYCDDGTDRWYLHGYVISAARSDCRVTFEGIGSKDPLDSESALQFVKDFRYADELIADSEQPAWCWYD